MIYVVTVLYSVNTLDDGPEWDAFQVSTTSKKEAETLAIAMGMHFLKEDLELEPEDIDKVEVVSVFGPFEELKEPGPADIDIPEGCRLCPECDGHGETESSYWNGKHTEYSWAPCGTCDGDGYIE